MQYNSPYAYAEQLRDYEVWILTAGAEEAAATLCALTALSEAMFSVACLNNPLKAMKTSWILLMASSGLPH